MSKNEAAQTNAGARATSLRNHNLQLLATAAIFASEPPSRADLATITGLNRSTVTRLVEQLLQQGILQEDSTKAAAQGRPAITLIPAGHTHVAIGTEVNADFISACIIDLTGEVLADTYQELDARKLGAKKTLLELARVINKLVQQCEQNNLHLAGITCGFFGILNPDNAVLRSSPALGWSDIDLKELLEQKVQTSTAIHYHNSAHLGAIAEYIKQRHQPDGLSSFIYISSATSIEAALILEKDNIPAHTDWAGALGHVKVTDQPTSCTCGATGCLEAVAGKRALLEQAGLTTTDSWPQLNSALARKDPTATSALKLAGTYLGTALSGVLNLVDCSNVIIGGHLGIYFDLIQENLMQEIERRALSKKWSQLEIRPALIDDRATPKGAAWNTLIQMLQHPDNWQLPHSCLLQYKSWKNYPEVTLPD